MNQKINKVRLIIFLLAISFAFYFTAVVTSIVDPSLSLSDDYCLEGNEEVVGYDRNTDQEKTEWKCYVFRSNLDEQKYYYNKAVGSRKLFWLIPEVIITTAVAFFAAKKIYPDPEERRRLYGDSLGYLFILVLFVGTIGSLILSFILPKPASYLPFITYQLDNWESNLERDINTGTIYINTKGEIIR